MTVKDVDWTVQHEGQACQKFGDENYKGHYCVRLMHQWWLVPDEAVITEPNQFGEAVVWPVYANQYNDGIETQVLENIRCFLRGTEG